MSLAYNALQIKTNKVGTAAMIKTIDKDMTPIVNLYKKLTKAIMAIAMANLFGVITFFTLVTVFLTLLITRIMGR